MQSDISLQELATLTKRHIETIRRLARQGKIPGAYRIGNRWMIRAEAVNQLRGLTCVYPRQLIAFPRPGSKSRPTLLPWTEIQKGVQVLNREGFAGRWSVKLDCGSDAPETNHGEFATKDAAIERAREVAKQFKQDLDQDVVFIWVRPVEESR